MQCWGPSCCAPGKCDTNYTTSLAFTPLTKTGGGGYAALAAPRVQHEPLNTCPFLVPGNPPSASSKTHELVFSLGGVEN